MASRRSKVVAASIAALVAILTSSAVMASALAGSSGSPVHVKPGHILRATVGGFAPNVRVTERQFGGHEPSRTRTTRSNRHGVVHVAYRVPLRQGRYRLMIVGRVPGSGPTGPRPLPSGRRDRQVVEVMVPKLVTIKFIVTRHGGLGTKGVHTGPPNGNGGGGGGSGTGGLADTGVDSAALLELAGLILTAGLVFVGAGRRRRV